MASIEDFSILRDLIKLEDLTEKEIKELKMKLHEVREDIYAICEIWVKNNCSKCIHVFNSNKTGCIRGSTLTTQISMARRHIIEGRGACEFRRDK